MTTNQRKKAKEHAEAIARQADELKSLVRSEKSAGFPFVNDSDLYEARRELGKIISKVSPL